MKNPIISVIIPVYNEEERIEKCISSVMNQTLKDLEIIVVNDGSTDKTFEIVSNLCLNDNRVKLHSYPNGGAAFAMSMGLKHAMGKYIIILDADDWVEPTMYEIMCSKILGDDTDLVVCNIQKHTQSEFKTTLSYSEDCIEEYDLLEKYIAFRFDYSLCNKLYKRSLIEQYNIDFNHDFKMGQDIGFNLQVFSIINKLSVIVQPLYHYVFKEGSMVTSSPQKRITSYNLIIKTFKEFCDKNHFRQQWRIFSQNIGIAYQSYFFNLLLNSNYSEKMGFISYYNYLHSSLKMMDKILIPNPSNSISIRVKFKNLLLFNGYFKTFAFLAALRHKTIIRNVNGFV